ncbi:MAG: acetyl-CoA carboxylase biotin carboxyl carrier protein subunit [Bacteroidales bacterium]|nr:acetyl-CoA carboxylase biotin carboxyl carrier protein subunit [Bacteroidales bacterium]MBN2820614.1 acetyl-CoA carboxylase biotin carboxyl carrier protein subunit [Bacteroidales bacterium]
MAEKKKNKELEFIAVSTKNNKYKVKNIFSEDLKINYKKFDFQIFDDENGFTYIKHKNKKYHAEILEKNQNKYEILLNGVSYSFSIETPFSYTRKRYLDKQKSKSKVEILQAPMPGKIIDVLVEPGAVVKNGETVIILEAMKMQNEITIQANGKVTKVHVKPNDTVNKDDILIEVNL